MEDTKPKVRFSTSPKSILKTARRQGEVGMTASTSTIPPPPSSSTSLPSSSSPPLPIAVSSTLTTSQASASSIPPSSMASRLHTALMSNETSTGKIRRRSTPPPSSTKPRASTKKVELWEDEKGRKGEIWCHGCGERVAGLRFACDSCLSFDLVSCLPSWILSPSFLTTDSESLVRFKVLYMLPQTRLLPPTPLPSPLPTPSPFTPRFSLRVDVSHPARFPIPIEPPFFFLLQQHPSQTILNTKPNPTGSLNSTTKLSSSANPPSHPLFLLLLNQQTPSFHLPRKSTSSSPLPNKRILRTQVHFPPDGRV